MRLNRMIQRVLLGAIFLLLCSCSVATQKQTTYVDPGATLHLYLDPLPQEAHHLNLTVTDLNARTRDGRDIPLLSGPWILDPARTIGLQTKLLQKKLPLGDYVGLSLKFSEATIMTEEGPVALLVDPDTEFLPRTFSIVADRAQTLFLSLNPERLVAGGYKLNARFSVWKPQPPLPALKGVVTHPAAGTMTVFEKKTPALSEVIAIGRQPAGTALDSNGRLVYLALSGENSIVVFDLVHNRIQRKVRLHAGARPTRLVLSADGATLVSLNPGSGSVSLFDTASLSERQRILFPVTPEALIAGADRRRVYVTLPDINTLALIDLDRAAVVASASLTETATSGTAGRSGRVLYLLTENSPNLLIADADNLAIVDRIHIGYGARCLALNRNNGLVYVGMQSGEIAVVDPQVGLPIDGFRAEPGIVDLVVDPEENSLFVASGQKGSLIKYDLVGKKRLGTLQMGAASYEIAVMGED